MAINTILRALAAIFDFILLIPVHLVLVHNSQYQSLELFIFNWFELHTALPWFLLSILPALVMIFVLVIFVRIGSQLLFNRSPGMALIGLSREDKGIRGRLLGTIYTLSSTLFWPVNLILESLDLVSFSRLLSGTEHEELDEIPKIRMIVGAMIIFTLIGISIIIPISYYDGEDIQLSTDRRSVHFSDFSDKPDDLETKMYQSERLKMVTLNNLDDGRFVLIPDYDFYKISRSVKYEPVLYLYDKETNSRGKLIVHGQIDLAGIVKNAFLGDPLFSLTNENLYKEIINEKVKNSVAWEKKSSFLGLMHPLATEELVDLIRMSLEFDILELPLQSLSAGPFFEGKLWLRRQLTKILEISSKSKISLITLGNFKFLSSINTRDGEGYRELLIPLGTRFPLLYEIEWIGKEGGAEAGQRFKNAFLSHVNWFFDYKDFFKNPMKIEEMTVMQVFDQLTAKEISSDRIELLERFIYRFFYNQCRSESSQNNPALRSLLKRSLERINNMISTRNRYEQTFSSFFQGQMESLVKAYSIKNRKYFNL